MEALLTLVVMGSVAAIAIPLAVLLEWWSVRGLLLLAVMHARSKTTCPESVPKLPAGRGSKPLANPLAGGLATAAARPPC